METPPEMSQRMPLGYPPLPSDSEDDDFIASKQGGTGKVLPIREQRAYDNNNQLTGMITHHVPWTPGEMNTFLNSIPKPRHSPHLFAM